MAPPCAPHVPDRSGLLAKPLHYFLSFLLLLVVAGTGQAQSWQIIGRGQQVASAASNYTSVVTVQEGGKTVPYVAFTENGMGSVKKWVEEKWVYAGSGGLSNGAVSHTALFTDKQNRIYVTYVDAASIPANRLAVKTLNPETNNWEALDGNSANLYVSAGSVTNSVSQLAISHNNWMAFDNDHIPYIVYAEMSLGGSPIVKRFLNGVWETVGVGAVAAEKASGVGIAFDAENTPYLTYAAGTGTTGPLKLFRLQDGTWQSIAVPGTVNGAGSGSTTNVRHANIVIDKSNNPVLAYFNASNSNRATVIS